MRPLSEQTNIENAQLYMDIHLYQVLLSNGETKKKEKTFLTKCVFIYRCQMAVRTQTFSATTFNRCLINVYAFNSISNFKFANKYFRTILFIFKLSFGGDEVRGPKYLLSSRRTLPLSICFEQLFNLSAPARRQKASRILGKIGAERNAKVPRSQYYL